MKFDWDLQGMWNFIIKWLTADVMATSSTSREDLVVRFVLPQVKGVRVVAARHKYSLIGGDGGGLNLNNGQNNFENHE